jgi:hypothetical protein
MELYCNLILNFGMSCRGYVGDFELGAPASRESSLEYHTCHAEILTLSPDRARGQCQAGSLTGAVAS